jgi:hypothetical protein
LDTQVKIIEALFAHIFSSNIVIYSSSRRNKKRGRVKKGEAEGGRGGRE